MFIRNALYYKFKMFYPVDDSVWRKSTTILENNMIKNVYLRNDGSVGAEVMSLTRKDVYYAVGIEPDQTYICGCLGYLGSGTACSHIISLVRYLEEVRGIKYNIFDRRLRRNYNVSFMETTLKNINDLIGIKEPYVIPGGLPKGIVLGLTADAETGKSILGLQMMYETMSKMNCNALVINTEPGSGINNVYMMYWGKVFGERYNLPDVQVVELTFSDKKRKGEDRSRIKFKHQKYDKDKPVMFFADYSDSDQILKLLGRKIKLEIGSTGKILPVYDTDELLHVSETALGKFIKENNIGYVLFDSITEPINQFIGGLKNYPGRHEATNVWMKLIRDYASFFNLIMIGTHHETVIGFGGGQYTTARSEIKGGKAIRHSFKFNMLMESIQKAKNRPHRLKKIAMERHPFKTPMKDVRYLVLTDRGYYDIEGDPKYDNDAKKTANELGFIDSE